SPDTRRDDEGRPELRATLTDVTLIGLLALLVRVVFALAFSRTPIGSLVYLDAETYDRLALALMERTGPALEPFFVEPLYAYVLAAIYGVFGRGLLPVRILQILGGVAAAILVYLVARRLYGRWAGQVAGGVAALYGPFVFYDSMLLKTSGEVLMAALLSWLLVRTLQGRSRWIEWVTIGLVLGLAVMLKANFLVLAPVVLGAPFLVAGGNPRRALAHSVTAGVALGLVLLPILVRNTVLAGEPTFLTNNAGMNFYQGNREGTDGGLDIPEFIRTDPTREQADSVAEARRRIGDPELSAADASSFWFAESLRFIRDQPGGWLRLMLRKTLLFWNDYEAADNLSFHYTRDVVPWLWLAPLGFWLVAPLGLAGTLAGAGGGRAEWPLRAAVLLLTLGTVLFHVADRYRLAAVPVLIVLGAGFVRRIGERWRRGRRRAAVAAVGLALGAALLVMGPDLYPGGQDMATYDRIMALGYARQGDEARAAPYRERAVAAYYRQGLALLDRGQDDRAEINLLQLAQLEPDQPGLWYHLGIAEERLGQPARAASSFARENPDGPYGVSALTRLARLHLRAGRLEAAEQALLRGREVDPRNPALLVVLGDLRALQERFDEALDHFEAALELDPGAEPVTRRIEAARARLESAGGAEGR
ncbi:MAG TPA: glycosyltransferase family 39 protein, partial [Thermoanaerobaculia bacterium]|nr:glycosyltransferase family 39 protein [Thermoanaerobaculia bacterium]